MKNIITFDELESTNKYAKEKARKGAPEWTVIVANHQSAGYGRMKRSFYSPPGTGLYMSIILRPTINVSDALLITTAAAAAVSHTIEEISNKETKIKWVNDIFIDNKKVCGILTEAGFSGNGTLDYAILGIGINIYKPEYGFPSEIQNIAGSVFDEPTDENIRKKLCINTLEKFEHYYNDLNSKSFLEYYKSKSNVLGKRITVITNGGCYDAKAIDFDDKLRLIIEKENGEIAALDSAEISIKL